MDTTLADPLEGVEYGRGKAKIMRRADGTVWIHSFAHGRTDYELIDAPNPGIPWLFSSATTRGKGIQRLNAFRSGSRAPPRRCAGRGSDTD